jgi:hypothetical protein
VTSPRAWPLLAVAASLAWACGDNGTRLSGQDAGKDHAGFPPGTDASEDARDATPEQASGDVYPAPHPPMPQVMNFGGPVLSHPRVVPVFYEADPLMPQIETFLTSLTTATYWAGATAEYGVGPVTFTAPVVVPGTPPASMTDSGIQALITAHLMGAPPDAGDADGGAWPPPDTDTIYAIFFAETTSIAFDGITSCTDFAGYHDEVSYAGGKTSYAVLPRCATFPLLPGESALDILTVATVHELIEASTDPFPFTNPAYANADQDGSGWAEATVGGEIADMCVLEPSTFITPPDVGFLVQRVWSNANAAASRDPCAPVPAGEVYFNAVPELSMTEMHPGAYLDGIQVPPGGTGTAALHLFSDAKTSEFFTISVTETGITGTRVPPDPSHQLSFDLDRATGQNGDLVTLTIHRKPLAGGKKAAGLAFQITATLGAEGSAVQHSYWGIAGY